MPLAATATTRCRAPVPNADVLAGNAGNDFFAAVVGPDSVDGGAGVDTLSFAGQTGATTVTLDDQANDGPASGGGTANVASSVENLVGGPAADTFVGSSAGNRLEGGGGGDLLRGDAGSDVLLGEAGDDTIEARDGTSDSVDCGPGNDIARVDPPDAVTNCETVILPDDDADGVSLPADCNDGDAGIRPGAVDRPGDGIDQDCSGADAPAPGGGTASGAGAPGLVDQDRDGTAPPQDCNDANPAIRPGAPDRPGNSVDEDCSGADSPFPRVAATIATAWVVGTVTRVIRLDARNVPTGGRVEVRCRGRGCAFVKRTVRPRRGQAQLGRLFRGRGLRAGAVIEVRVLAPDHIGKVVRYTIRRNRLPRDLALCLPPGTRTPLRC